MSDEASKAPTTPKSKKNAPEKNRQKTKAELEQQQEIELEQQQETERREKEDEEQRREAERLRKEKEERERKRREKEEEERQARELRQRLMREKDANEKRERREAREREKVREVERKAALEAREAEENAKHLEKKKQREKREKDRQKKAEDGFGSADGLDDLINNLDSMLEDAPTLTKLAPIGGSARRAKPAPALGSKPEFEETKTKCFTAFLDGTKSSGGFRQFCKSLYCRGCDMGVERFPDKKWDSSVNYLFFRNYHPNHDKLAPKLHPCEGTAAYCCQCTWRNIDSQLNISLDPKLKWFCMGC